MTFSVLGECMYMLGLTSKPIFNEEGDMVHGLRDETSPHLVMSILVYDGWG